MAVKLTIPSGLPQASVEKPTQVVGPQSTKREEKVTPLPPGLAANLPYKLSNFMKCPSCDVKGNPLCFKCREIGWASECPNHTWKTQVFVLGVGDVPLTNETDILVEDANGLVGEPQDGGTVVGDEAEDHFVCHKP